MDNAELIWRLKDHRDLQIRRAVISILPTLAVYDTQTFTESFLHRSMGYLIPLLKRAGVERALGECCMKANCVDVFYLTYEMVDHVSLPCYWAYRSSGRE